MLLRLFHINGRLLQVGAKERKILQAKLVSYLHFHVFANTTMDYWKNSDAIIYVKYMSITCFKCIYFSYENFKTEKLHTLTEATNFWHQAHLALITIVI